MRAGRLLKAVGPTAAKSGLSSRAFARLLLCPPARGTSTSSHWEGSRSEHRSVWPNNMHPTSLALGTTRVFLICVCVTGISLFSLPSSLPLTERLCLVPALRSALWHFLFCSQEGPCHPCKCDTFTFREARGTKFNAKSLLYPHCYRLQGSRDKANEMWCMVAA